MTLEDFYKNCQLCPRRCGVNRYDNQLGYCHETAELNIGRAALHFWEEPCLSGEKGSGAIFFAGCNMNCIFCQNRVLSQGKAGKRITGERLVEIFFELKAKGAHNINLVTPTHYVPHIRQAIIEAKIKGFDLPFIYNCSGFEKVETLKSLEGLIDVYLPDFKYNDEEIAIKYSQATGYPERVKEALSEMVRQRGKVCFNEEGLMTEGVIVRHLILPGSLRDSKKIVKYLYDNYGNQIYISLMNQYTPMPEVLNHPLLGKKIKKNIYERLIQYAIDLGVENAFVQEGGTARESFIPIFNGEGV